jgi:hypothetical protein
MNIGGFMKAAKGTKITCSSCKQAAGRFRKDVAEGSPITSDDVDMDGEYAIPSHQDGGRKWNCLKCNLPVAELTGQPSHWRVQTARGWIV